MLVRKVNVSDAEKLVQLIKQVESESQYMLMEPGERKITAEQQKQRIEAFEKSGNSAIFVSEDMEQLVGYLFVMGGTARKTNHSAYIVIGILNNYRGKGIGTQLFEKMEQWASERKFHRLELTVVTKNTAGLGLYKKMGFEIEGTKRHSLLINDEYADEYYMAKLL